MRRDILMRDYNFFCECEGCLDEERNERMEGWHCEECQDGWLRQSEQAKCTRCGWEISMDHYELCRMAQETARSGNEFLLKSHIKLQDRVELACRIFPILEGTLYKFNVLRIPSLRVLFENAVCEKNTEDILKYGYDLLRIQQQYQSKDDLALCHLKYGLAQAHKLAGDHDKCKQLLAEVKEVHSSSSECVVLMSVDFGWRRFNFFDKNIVNDPENPEEKFLGLKDVCVDCWCSSINGEAAYLGEQRGGVFRLGRGLDENYWKAYQTSLTALHVAEEFIFSIGEDEEGTNSMLKIWKGDCFEKGVPVLCREIRISTVHPSSHYSVAACAVAVHSTLSAIVIGFVDGTVLLYQGNVIKDKALTSRWQRIRDPLPLDGCVSGLALAQLPGEKLVVFVITTKVVNSYVIENKTVINSVRLLCFLQCQLLRNLICKEV
ncbi:hypothetical protein COOONC_17240 [Cooperia oncophora]